MKIKDGFRKLLGDEIYRSISNKKREIELTLFPEKILMRQFENVFGYKFDINSPQTFNEKLMWLKINWRDDLATKCADKYLLHEYVRDVLGSDKFTNEIYGVYNDVDSIDISKLPDSFVMKVTHGSGQNIFCTNKSKLDLDTEKIRLKKWMKKSAYYYAGEWVYKGIKPRIICEKVLEQDDSHELRDYRFFCFNGEPRFISVDFNIINKDKTRRNLYNLKWEKMDAKITYPNEMTLEIKKPDKLDQMIEISKKLSAPFPHCRVDFYYINDQIIVGEMTFFHYAGLGIITPREYDLTFGNWLQLPE